jgi:hypothetical protein
MKHSRLTMTINSVKWQAIIRDGQGFSISRNSGVFWHTQNGSGVNLASCSVGTEGSSSGCTSS